MNCCQHRQFGFLRITSQGYQEKTLATCRSCRHISKLLQTAKGSEYSPLLPTLSRSIFCVRNHLFHPVVGLVLSICIVEGQDMIARGLGRIRGRSAKEDRIPNVLTSFPHPTTLSDSAISRAKRTLSHRSSAGDVARPNKTSGLDRALKLFHPRRSRNPKAELRIAPSGAIVFTAVRSQESLGSSMLPGRTTPSPTSVEKADERAQRRLQLYHLQTRVPQDHNQLPSNSR